MTPDITRAVLNSDPSQKLKSSRVVTVFRNPILVSMASFIVVSAAKKSIRSYDGANISSNSLHKVRQAVVVCQE